MASQHASGQLINKLSSTSGLLIVLSPVIALQEH